MVVMEGKSTVMPSRYRRSCGRQRVTYARRHRRIPHSSTGTARHYALDGDVVVAVPPDAAAVGNTSSMYRGKHSDRWVFVWYDDINGNARTIPVPDYVWLMSAGLGIRDL